MVDLNSKNIVLIVMALNKIFMKRGLLNYLKFFLEFFLQIQLTLIRALL